MTKFKSSATKKMFLSYSMRCKYLSEKKFCDIKYYYLRAIYLYYVYTHPENVNR